MALITIPPNIWVGPQSADRLHRFVEKVIFEDLVVFEFDKSAELVILEVLSRIRWSGIVDQRG